MRYVYWIRVRSVRLLTILLALVLYFVLLVLDVPPFFPARAIDFSSLLLLRTRFGFAALIALMFLAVGALVWLYARSRYIAWLLFLFSLAGMVTFAVEPGAGAKEHLLLAIGGASSGLAFASFSILLLLFPRNYLSSSSPSAREAGGRFRPGRGYYYALLLRGYAAILALMSIVAVFYSFIDNLLAFQPIWLNTLVYSYDAVALLGCLVTIIVSYRKSYSLRERQQFRLFVIGVVLAIVPFFILTVAPLALRLRQYAVDAQLSTLSFALLPLALGYSILRYQIIVFDMYVRRAVAWIVGGVGLALLGYLVVTFSRLLLSSSESLRDIAVTFAMAIFGPFVWWLAKVMTDRLFFREIAHYRRLIEEPDLLAHETFNLEEASQLITLSAVTAFETQEVCLLVLDDDTGYYQLCPGLKDDDPNAGVRRNLVQQLFQAVKPTAHGITGWLDADEPLIKRLETAKRPLLLSEATRAEEDIPIGLSRFLTTTSPMGKADPLLAPVRAQGKMIGVLVLGERGDHQQYAGPDFEAIHLILGRFSSVLETARLYAQASRHVAILNTLYSADTISGQAFQSVEDVAIAYAKIAAEAVMGGAELWLYNGQTALLRRVIHVDAGPELTRVENLKPSQERDWASWFYQGDNPHACSDPSDDVPPCLPQTPSFPFAWLPLNRGQHHLGMLVLTYPRPHVFSREEIRVLEMFASKCAVTLDNTRITLELRAAYERQKELDRLKDQFIMTASHELRTPLTAVQGYIELLNEYYETLPPKTLGDFIAKAHRGCDELTLMVGNIMDASHVQVDAENIRLSKVSLVESVFHILEILEAMTKREKRVIEVDIPDSLFVMADAMRLRQVLLNLVSNALKYSSAGSGVEIGCEADDEIVTVRLRDHGMGVPPEDQDYLFQRFVRLERDMNSPIRGAGLGLYICRQLIQAMGGRIWVESTGIPGEGSTFIFTLKRASLDQEVPAKEALERQNVL